MWDRTTTQGRNRDARVFILFILTIDAVGFGIMIPVMPQLIVELTGQDIARAAVYGGWLTALYSIVQFVAAPVLGNLSDCHGRRPVLLASLTGFGINYLIMGFAPSLSWLFVGQILAGAFAATPSTASAFIADTTAVENRAKQFGLLSAAFSIGLILGPMLGGVLGEYGPRVPFFVAGGFALLNVAYGFFMLPESLRTENRRPFSAAHVHPLRAFARMRRHTPVFELFGVLGLMQVAAATIPVTLAYFTTLKFGWSRSDIGAAFGLYGVAQIIVQSIGAGPVNRRLGGPRTAYVGFCFMIASFLGFAFAGRSWLMLAFTVSLAFGSLAGPALISYMSEHVPVDSQGELQGAIASVNSAATILAPLLMTGLFSLFSAPDAKVYFPGAPYLLAAVLCASGLLLAMYVLRRHEREHSMCPDVRAQASDDLA